MLKSNEIKIQIQEYINQNMINEAEKLALNFKDKFELDEFASIQCIINLYRGNIDKALEYIKQGLKYNICNVDLYCNMGFIYELKEDFNRAYLCYEHALEYVNNENLKNDILQIIDMIKTNNKITVNQYSIIILTYNNLEYTKKCINSIRKYNRNNNYEIIIVDNNSTDGTKEWIKKQENIKYILNDENKGFPAGCNQGINKSDKNNDIFLLNNDTLVMENSIFNLRMALYSSEKIGAAGPVTNSCSNYQEITQRFSDLDGYERFALNNNIPNELMYEKKIKLIGFAMMIKREVLNKIGLLDERFTPGNFEDDDLSYRILKSDYELLLCLDSYIHHFGGASFKKLPDEYIKLLKKNSEKFNEKWGFYSEYNSVIRYKLIAQIKKNLNDVFRVLDIGCNCGGTLLALKNIYKNCEIYGIENNKECVEICRRFVNVQSLNIEEEKLPYEEKFFDYIIFNDLSKKENYQDLLKILKTYLKEGGQVIY